MSIQYLDDVSKIIVSTYNIAKNGIVTKKIILPNEPPRLFANLTKVKDGVYYDIYELCELIEKEILKKDNNTFIYDKEREMEYSDTIEIETILRKEAETLHLHRNFKNYIHEDNMDKLLKQLDKQADLLKVEKKPESKIVEQTNDNNIIDNVEQTQNPPQEEQKKSHKLAIAIENQLKRLNEKKENYYKVKNNREDKKTKIDPKRLGALGLALLMAGTIYIANRNKSNEKFKIYLPLGEIAENVDDKNKDTLVAIPQAQNLDKYVENQGGEDEVEITKEVTLEDLYNNISIGESYYIQNAPLSTSVDSSPISEIGENNEYAPSGKYQISQVVIAEYLDEEKTQIGNIITNIGIEQIGNNLSKIMSKNDIPENYKIMVHLKDENGNSKGWTEVTKEVFKELEEELKTVTISYRR